MMRTIMATVAMLTIVAPATASPKPCRNGAGKLMVCPKPVEAAPHRCKDAKGRFVACDHDARAKKEPTGH